MILLTGWSQKLDGIAFLANTDDEKEALRMLCAAWNDHFTDKMKIVQRENELGLKADYMLSVEVEDSAVLGFEDGTPRREGWNIIAQQVESGEVIRGCPW